MNEIADACYDPEAYHQILGVLARRLQEREERWRCCYKALLLLEHLIKHGPPKIVQDVQSSMSVLERLQHFQYKDPNGRDHGANVRHRAKELIDLVSSADRIQQEREKAKANRSKYRGVSGDEIRVGGFGSTTTTTSSSYGAGGASGGYSGSNTKNNLSTRRPGESWGGTGTGSGMNNSSTRPSYSYNSNEGTGAGYNNNNITSSSSNPSTGRQGDFLHISSDRSNDGGGGNTTEAVTATQERIERLRLAKAEEERRHAMFEKEQQQQQQGVGKKKLADVKVNPKIAASLGLKIPPPSSSSSSSSRGGNNNLSLQQQQQQNPTELLADLLGDALTINPEDNNITNTNTITTGGDGDDLLGDVQQPTAPPSSGGGDVWDAFGDMPSRTTTPTTTNNGGGALNVNEVFGTSFGGDVLSTLSPSASSSSGGGGGALKLTKSNQPMAVNAKPTASTSKDPFADLLG
jgi:epsin